MAVCSSVDENDNNNNNKENLPPNSELPRSSHCKGKQRVVRRPLEDITHLFSLSNQLGHERPRRIPSSSSSSSSSLASLCAGKPKCGKRRAGSCVNSASKKPNVMYKSINFR